MKAVIVNCFDTYEDRINLLYEFFKNTGHDITVIQSDFRHFKKIHRTDIKTDFVFVKSKPYFKNLSIARLSSHYFFAKQAFKIVEDINPDLLYVIIPPNSLAKFASQYKRKNKKVKLIFDLIDLWPETIPLGKVKSMPPFTFWGMMRDKSIKFADIIITECNLYQAVLENVLKGSKTKTVYLAKRDINVVSSPSLTKDEMNLCYLGSINNIIDIPKIKEIVESFSKYKSTTLHIIGDGESKGSLIEEVKKAGAKVEYHGKIYDPQQKQNIFDKCHFGLNIMKDTVCVGLTMKSIDYFQHGLPIINNIKADTTEIVKQHKVGVNLSEINLNELANEVSNMDLEEYYEMRRNATKVFDELFSKRAFEGKINLLLEQL
ncbi:hypothetical protein J7E38_07355 [Bacillus sp. ISL-35]|uniref:glycosyltransferase n=1 Tax=Bacillus sp. ISL-35 TaxID=2819122 RepID=UPI001BEBA2F7|nr:glycosyltransferase [Bacillus sp. ISL-35]MBT2678817.1 hypothetical protein [Bacillus sp. ISL-35]MBT2703809.1 hypothetical protein [Chryseobacterium sp. ISL-80]